MKKLALCMVVLAVVALGGLRLVAQEPQVRGVLLTDASRDESSVWLTESPTLQLDGQVVLESRDGSYRGVYTVRHVFGRHLLLQSKLREDYVAGSRVLQ